MLLISPALFAESSHTGEKAAQGQSAESPKIEFANTPSGYEDDATLNISLKELCSGDNGAKDGVSNDSFLLEIFVVRKGSAHLFGVNRTVMTTIILGALAPYCKKPLNNEIEIRFSKINEAIMKTSRALVTERDEFEEKFLHFMLIKDGAMGSVPLRGSWEVCLSGVPRFPFPIRRDLPPMKRIIAFINMRESFGKNWKAKWDTMVKSVTVRITLSLSFKKKKPPAPT